jgi:hypothetical protein
MADVRHLVVNEPLCFACSRIGKCRDAEIIETLKSFFKIEALVAAKVHLCNDIEKLELEKWPKPINHHDGDGRAQKEVKDIMDLLHYLDEKLLLNSLPIYACASPDSMPTTRWMDGDFQLILAKLTHLENHNEQLSAKVNLLESQLEKQMSAKSCKLENIEKQVQHMQASVENIHGEQVTSVAFDIYMASLEKTLSDLNSKVGCVMEQIGLTGAAKPIESIEPCIVDNHSTEVGQPSDNQPQLKPQATTTTQAAWAHVAAYDRVFHDNHENTRGNSNIGSATAESDVDMDGGHWREVTNSRRNRVKRMRTNSGRITMNQHDNPNNKTSSNSQQPKPHVKVIGKLQTASRIKSSGVAAQKNVFCISNLAAELTVEDVLAFLEENEITVSSCGPAKTKFADTSAFRVCIPASERDKFTCPDIWPEDVIIRDWFFKPKPSSNHA